MKKAIRNIVIWGMKAWHKVKTEHDDWANISCATDRVCLECQECGDTISYDA